MWRGLDVLWFLCCASAVISAVVAVKFRSALRLISRRPTTEDISGGPARVTAIVPARDEEGDLAASLRSVLDQAGVDLEVIVVNDHSSDRTGAIADSLAASDPRLTVIHDPVLPSGWLGKCNGMQQAAALAAGSFLVFTDADVRHEPTCFVTALAEMEGRRLDFLSFFPLMPCVSLWENAITPLLVGGLALYATPEIERDDAPEALAAGAFMMVRSDVFRAVGGFGPIRGEMLDDVGLARLVKANGGRVGFRAAPDLLEVRLFKGNHHAFWGTTKNILAGLGGRLWLAPAVMLLPVLVFWTPILCAAAGVWSREWGLVLLAAATYGLQYATLVAGRGLFRTHPAKLLSFPLVAVVVICCLGRALYWYSARGAVEWRGRLVRVREGPGGR